MDSIQPCTAPRAQKGWTIILPTSSSTGNQWAQCLLCAGQRDAKTTALPRAGKRENTARGLKRNHRVIQHENKAQNPQSFLFPFVKHRESRGVCVVQHKGRQLTKMLTFLERSNKQQSAVSICLLIKPDSWKHPALEL